MPTARTVTTGKINTAELISEISRYKRGFHLGEREEQFLSLIGTGYNSSYQIYSLMKKAKPSIDYKNINKRVKRLHELQLITETKGESIHNAIFYELSSEGLFYLISEGIFNLDKTWLSKYKDNIVLKYLLEPYFEESTVLVYGIKFEIVKYLQEGCQMILLAAKAIDGLSDHPQRKKAAEMIATQLQIDLEWHAKALAFKLISKKTDLCGYGVIGPSVVEFYQQYDKTKDAPNFENIKNRLLAKDKKFIRFSKNLGREFEQALVDLAKAAQKSQ